MIKQGDIAPDWQAMDQDGNIVSWKDFAGQKTILYFYPKDNTPGCTAQACNLSDNYASLQAAGFQIIGVSGDAPASHQKFIAKHHLPFTLISDTEHQVHKAYGTWQLKKFMGKEYMGTVRTTFIINAGGVVTHIIQKPKTKEHATEILALDAHT